MKRFVIYYGIIGAIASIILGLLNWFLIAPTYGPSVSERVGYTTIALTLMTIPLGIRYFRDKLNQGRVSFKAALTIGFGITLIMALIMGIYGMLFFAIEGDDFMTWHAAWASEVPYKDAQQQAAAMPEFAQSPIFQGIIMFVMVFLMGTIINIISALALKKGT